MAVFHNPIRRGFYPDPAVIRVGNDFYMVNSTFQYFPAIVISHSRDMIHWEVIGHAIDNNDWLDLRECGNSLGIWAPDISYHDGKFTIFATLRLNGDGKRGNAPIHRQLMVESEHPEGPYSKPVYLDVPGIDPSLFIDDDGKHYMILSPGICAVEISPDNKEVLSEKMVLWEGTGLRCPEGPHIYKIGEYYYAMLAEGGTGYGHQISVGRSKSLMGPYEASPYNPLMHQFDENALIQRTGHGCLVDTPDGDWWCYYLCGRANEGHYTTVGRETALDHVEWTADGWFTINGGKGPSVEAEAPKLNTFEYEEWAYDEFDPKPLHKEWLWSRNPNGGDWSLDENPGHMRIWTSDGTLDEIRAKNILLRRETELSYSATTKCEFYPSKDGENAGLTCYYSTQTYARFSICYEGGRKLQLVINKNHGEEVVVEIDGIKERPVYLMVQVYKQTRQFLYSYDGEAWNLAGTLHDCTFLCDEGVPDDPKRHTGTLVGIYANNGGAGTRIHADFDYFDFKPMGEQA